MLFPGRAPAGALLAAVVVVPTVLVAPTVTLSRPEPRPVAADVQHLSLSGVDSSALRRSSPPPEAVAGWVAKKDLTVGEAIDRVDRQDPVLLTETMDTDRYRMLGVTWDADTRADVIVSGRTRTDGVWTDWFHLDAMEDLDSRPAPNGRVSTAPYWAGDSDGLQLRVDAIGADQPTDIGVDLIEPGTSDADAAILDSPPAGSAFASTDKPKIVTRAQWGADESLRDKHLDMSQTVKVGFVHHTVGSNSYGPNEGPAVVRGLYSYYVNSLGYADIGYNFLVDKYGNVYEGRAGSITKPVRQAATGGFNKDTMSVAALGNFETAPASDALVRGIAHILAYRLSAYHRNPYGTKTLRAETGSSRYDKGDKATFKVISGHRNAGYTACPGQHLYDRLGAIRRKTKQYMGSNLVEPSVSTRSVPVGSDRKVTVKSRVLQQQAWTLTVTKMCDGTVVRRFSGNAAPSKPIKVTWGGRNTSGKRVAPGRYRLSLSSSGNGSQAWPWSTSVAMRVGGSASPRTGTSLPAVGAGTYVPVRPTVLANTVTGQGVGRPVLLGAGSRVDVPVLGRGKVPANGVSTVAVAVQASCASRSTNVTVAPGGLNVPGARAVTVDGGGTASGVTLVRLGSDGGLTFRNATGAVALKVSVVGYVSTKGVGGSLVPVRRKALAGARPLSTSTSAVDVSIAGRAGVPNDARAVVLNVRRLGSKVTSLWAWPRGGTKPAPSIWRRGAGQPAANRVVVPIGDQGDIRVATDRAGSVSLDVVGYVARDDSRPMRSVVPKQLTKSGKRVAKGQAATVSVRGRAGVPSQARAVLVQVTGKSPKADSRLTVWPRGTKRPAPVDLIVPKRRDRDGLVLLPIGDHGDIRVHAAGAGVGLKVVVLGWVS